MQNPFGKVAGRVKTLHPPLSIFIFIYHNSRCAFKKGEYRNKVKGRAQGVKDRGGVGWSGSPPPQQYNMKIGRNINIERKRKRNRKGKRYNSIIA